MTQFNFANEAAPIRTLLIAKALVIGVLGFLAFAAWSMIQTNAAEIGNLENVIAQQEVVASQADATADDSDLYYVAETPQLAQAALSDTVQQIADRLGIELEILRAGDTEKVNDLVQLNLVVSGVVPEPALGQFMNEIATVRPVLILEDMNLRRARDLSRAVKVRKVAFQLDLRAFLKGQ